ncbi:SymE family type I addiction module toxin [Microbulbifer sp. DLAB2-AA]
MNLRGLWLEEAGFEIGAQHPIEVYSKNLIFTVT